MYSELLTVVRLDKDWHTIVGGLSQLLFGGFAVLHRGPPERRPKAEVL